MNHDYLLSKSASRRLRSGLKNLVEDQLIRRIEPWWFVTFHYRDNHTSEDQLIGDVADLRRKLRRLIYQARDRSVKGAGAYRYPKMLFFHEASHQGTGQLHTHMVLEALPSKLNTQQAVSKLFSSDLPQKVKALSRWKSVDIQRIVREQTDCRRLASYLVKQSGQAQVTLDAFNSDLGGNT